MLAGNQLGELADLDVLGKWERLTHLVLVDNPVTKKEVRYIPVKRGYWEVAGREGADCVVELPVLGPLAMPDCEVPRLSEGEAG